jgi:hypothetical protein
MSQYAELPPRVYPKGLWYYLVTAEGKKRVWTKLTLVRDGLPALYLKLADMHARDVAPTASRRWWLTGSRKCPASRAKKTQANDKWVMGAISEALGRVPRRPGRAARLRRRSSSSSATSRARTTKCAPACGS